MPTIEKDNGDMKRKAGSMPLNDNTFTYLETIQVNTLNIMNQ